ncbi:MAG: undecaprenyl-diphosphate phosphatase [Eubacteriaceae bacterium]
MTGFEAFILGLVQGLTEFLPVSSSGHLAILQSFMNLKEGALEFTVLLHLGTLIAVFLVYRKAVIGVIKAFFCMIADLFTEKSLMIKKDKYRAYVILLIIGSIPAGIAGVLFNDKLTEAFTSIILIAFMLIITGALLIIGEKIGRKNTLKIEQIKGKNAFLIGLFQMAALMPGLSRSGTAMVGGLVNGLKKEDAVEFSFLLSMPAVLGACILEAKDIFSLSSMNTSASAMLIGFLTAVIVGYLSIKLLILVVKKERLRYFAYYCWIVACAVLVKELFF